MNKQVSPNVVRRSVLAGLVAALAIARRAPAFVATAPETLALPIHTRGARVPAGLLNRVQAQNSSAVALEHALRADPNFIAAFAAANSHAFTSPPTVPATFDWRKQNRVTPVKDQQQCGSCWAFAAIAAYESAYLIANKLDAVKDGSSTIDVSEQEALDCAFVEDDCVLGGWHEVVFLYLQLQGEVGGVTYSYHGAKGFCTSNLQSRPYYAVNWGYVSDSTSGGGLLPSDLALKQAIYRYGAVASSVTTKDWDKYTQVDFYGKPNPRWSIDFPNGVFRGQSTSSLKVTDIDHEIAIVGWDDALGVWLIKNSWGTNWGDGGYMKLKYGSNYLGYGSSWVLVNPNGAVSSSLANQIKALTLQNTLLKNYPALNVQ